MAESATFSNAYDWLGFVGGLLLAIGLFPQVYRQIKTRSSRDISLYWLFAYVIGLAFYGIYTVSYKLWPIFAPAAVEFACICTSIVVKLVTDREWAAREKQKKAEAAALEPKADAAPNSLERIHPGESLHGSKTEIGSRGDTVIDLTPAR